MDSVKITLLCDGSSDRVIIPIVEKLFDKHCHSGLDFDLATNLPNNAKTLPQRIQATLLLYPCDLLIIHRDAEGQSNNRRTEIANAVAGLNQTYVIAMPIKMTEAWLLCDQQAIRHAAGNVHGNASLGIPPISKIETCDAKIILFAALRAAADLGTHRLQKFNPEQRRHLVAEQLFDFTSLRRLSSFADFEHQVIAYCNSIPC